MARKKGGGGAEGGPKSGLRVTSFVPEERGSVVSITLNLFSGFISALSVRAQRGVRGPWLCGGGGGDRLAEGNQQCPRAHARERFQLDCREKRGKLRRKPIELESAQAYFYAVSK